ncbi:hypothetical protein [uncultured Legionella sp.]|uniref:hypothetical protein n=1 Tax=uncultured Legionella sp. TaxID=210934 RepID=UPI002613AF52|nr:hypothetical protein [uncultured Legionella sp.]
MKDKTIQNKELSQFGLVKISGNPTKEDLHEFRYSMYILTETQLFLFQKGDSLSAEQTLKIEISDICHEKIQELFKEAIVNKRYQLTKFKLNTLIELIDNNTLMTKTRHVQLQTKRKRNYIDFPEPQPFSVNEMTNNNSINSHINGVVDDIKPSENSIFPSSEVVIGFRENINIESRRLSSEINKSIQDFLNNTSIKQDKNTKNNVQVRTDALRVNKNQLPEHLVLDLINKENEYNKLLHSIQIIINEIHNYGALTEKKTSIIKSCELAKIEKTTTTQIKSLLISAAKEKEKKESSLLSSTIILDPIDSDLSAIFKEETVDLITKLQTIKLKSHINIQELLTNIITEFNHAIFKINLMYCPPPIKKLSKDIDTQDSIQPPNNNENYAQRYIEIHTDAKKQVHVLKERLIKLLKSFEENGYFKYLSEKLMFNALEFSSNKNGIYFNSIRDIEQEIIERKQIAVNIEKKMIIDIHSTKSQQMAIAEIELYLNHGIDFYDLRKNFSENQKKCEQIQKNKSVFTSIEVKSLQKKSDYFIEALRQEQQKRQNKIRDCEAFLDNCLSTAGKKHLPEFIISLIINLKKEMISYKLCDTSSKNLIMNMNCTIKKHLTEHNLENLPFYGNQNKEFLLDFFDVINEVLNAFTTDSNKSPMFFSREIKEIEHAKTIEQLTQFILNITQLLQERLEIKY